MSSPIDLSLLPAPDVIEPLDYEQILAERKAAFIDLVPANQQAEVTATLELESEPLTILLEESALRELTLRNRINDAARAVMLAYARGNDMDQIGANFNTQRLLITPADPDAVPPTDAVYESEEAYQLRIQEAFDGLSVAGPGAAYEFFARSAHGHVADASCVSPAPCEIVMSILSTEEDGTAGQYLIDAVATALSPEEVRPMGDLVTVQSAEIIDYQIEAVIYVPSSPEASIMLAAAQDRIAKEVKQKRPLGRSVYRTRLGSVLHVEGVIKIDLIQPAADIVLTRLQAARCTGINVIAEVLDE